MRAAPACELDLTPGRTERWACLALVALSGGTLGAWLSSAWAAWHTPWNHPGLAAALAAVAAAALCLRLAARALRVALASSATRLRWTGQAWDWAPCGPAIGRWPLQNEAAAATSEAPAARHLWQAAELELAIDLGPWVLLRARLPSEPGGHCARRPWQAGHTPSRTRWAVAAEWRCPARAWHAMRVAWQAHAGLGRLQTQAAQPAALPERPSDDR